MEENNNERWKFCAVGNIVRTRIDENGKEWHGTSAFRPGAKVYLQGKWWDEEDKEIDVIGYTRGNKYKAIRVPVDVIENVRTSRVFTPQVLDIMEDWEFFDCWWHKESADRRESKEFVKRWNEYASKRPIEVNEKHKSENIFKQLSRLLGKKNRDLL